MGNIIALLKEIVELLKNKNDILTLNIETAAKVSGIGIHKINELINRSNVSVKDFTSTKNIILLVKLSKH